MTGPPLELEDEVNGPGPGPVRAKGTRRVLTQITIHRRVNGSGLGDPAPTTPDGAQQPKAAPFLAPCGNHRCFALRAATERSRSGRWALSWEYPAGIRMHAQLEHGYSCLVGFVLLAVTAAPVSCSIHRHPPVRPPIRLAFPSIPIHPSAPPPTQRTHPATHPETATHACGYAYAHDARRSVRAAGAAEARRRGSVAGGVRGASSSRSRSTAACPTDS